MNTINRLELKQLRILKALLQERNVSKVASQMGLTQQAISDHLRRLRDIFEDRLFVRSSNGLIATPAAQVLEQKIDKILADVEELLAPDKFDPATVNARFTLAATDYAQQIVLPPLLTTIRQQAPGLEVVILDFDQQSVYPALASGQIDLAITYPDYLPSHYPSITLFKEHFVCVTASSADIDGQPLSLHALAKLPQIAVSPARNDSREALTRWFDKAGIERNTIITAPCSSVVPSYIEATGAIAFLPSRNLPREGLKEVELQQQPDSFEVVMTWHSRSSQATLHGWIKDLLTQQSH